MIVNLWTSAVDHPSFMATEKALKRESGETNCQEISSEIHMLNANDEIFWKRKEIIKKK